MSQSRKPCALPFHNVHQIRGTGNILQDLISSTVLLERVKLINSKSKSPSVPNQNSDQPLTPAEESCSICGQWSESCHPWTLIETEIFEQCVLKPLFVQEDEIWCFNWLCRSCSRTLKRLTNLKSEIDQITHCLRALVRIQLRKEENGSLDTEAENVVMKFEVKEEDEGFSCIVQDSCEAFAVNLEQEPERNCATTEALEERNLEGHAISEVVEHPPEALNSKVKRKCAARAEELLQLMAKSDHEEDEVSDDDTDSYTESGDEEESDTDLRENGVGTRKQKRRVNHDGALVCGVCRKKCLDPKELELHKSRKHFKVKCDICEISFSSDSSYKTHLSSMLHDLGQRSRRCNKDESGASFFCDACGASYRFVGKLSNHIDKYHSDGELTEPKPKEIKYHYCEPCNKTFRSARYLANHLLTDEHEEISKLGEKAIAERNSKKKFKCEICEKRFESTADIRKHRQTHYDPRRKRKKQAYICDRCGQELPSFKFLQRHIRRKHSDEPKKIIKNRLIPPKDKPFPCKVCSKRFTSLVHLRHHLNTIHHGYRYPCKLCSMDFISRGSLWKHERTLHGSGAARAAPNRAKTISQTFSCDICLKTMKGHTQITKHIELHHFSDKSSCPYGCPDKIENEQEWTNHLEGCKSEKLNEASKCKCHFCLELFPNQLLRIAHHLRLHKCFPCEFCSRSFTRNNALTVHKFQHQEANPFLCPKCGKRFRQPHGLKRHLTTVCGDDEDAKRKVLAKRLQLHQIYVKKPKPHKCDLCSKAFVVERRLEEHVRKVHLNKNKESANTDDEESSDSMSDN